MKWLANPNWGCSHFLHKFWSSHEYLFIIKVKILVLLNGHIGPPPKLCWSMIECKMVISVWACGPIFSNHMSFWYLFLEPHLTTYHSNIGVRLRQVTELGICTLHLMSTLTNSDFISSRTCPSLECKISGLNWRGANTPGN